MIKEISNTRTRLLRNEPNMDFECTPSSSVVCSSSISGFIEGTTQDMLVSVIRSDLRDATDRRCFEARMIFKHRTLHPGGLKVDFGSPQSQRAL